jgi:putative ABC transport system permease protein
MSSIALGVAALVAIDSYAGNINRSVRDQSRSLVGGDVALSSRQAWSPQADSLLDSLVGTGVALARQTTFGSMALVQRPDGGGGTRLSQVRAVTPGFPLYGRVGTEPAGRWSDLHSERIAIVDPSLLLALDAQVGDTVRLGYGKFVIAATITTVPGDPGFASAFGPRVYIGWEWVPETRLLTFGSRAEYDAFIRLEEGANPDQWIEPLRTPFEKARVRARTVSQRENNLTESIDQLANFLGVVGIIALLLGGVGVASGVNAWIARKIEIVAVLRCLGGTSRQVMLIYATQAAIMGFVGAAVGAAIGVGIQFALPSVVRDYLPLEVEMRVEPWAIGSGLLLGVWIALAFALRPLVALRRVSPLQAIRRTVDPGAGRRNGTDWMLVAVNTFIAATVVGISATRSESLQDVAGFSAGIAAVLGLLWASAVSLSRLARAAVSARWPYVVRQGVANLYRPANQTRAVVLSLGFGAFLVTTLYLVQSNLLNELRITEMSSRGNLVFFDVQQDQGAGVDSIVRTAQGIEVVETTPIVTMRIFAINGTPIPQERPRRDTTVAPGSGNQQPQGWALRREYRSTYRDSLGPGERLIAGKWFGAAPAPAGGPPHEVSIEVSIAEDLGVSLGDAITWDVQGVKVETRITSLREVNWARFEPNFFAVFPPTALAEAPHTLVVLASAPEGAESMRVQRDIVRVYPNVASIDLSDIRRTIGEISRRATLAIRFLTVFSLAMGIPVLFSAVSATRRERIREGVLLKTLGATRRQIGRILLSEYTLLGLLGAATGMVLAIGGAWAIMKWVFERPFEPALAAATGIAAAMLVLAVSIGLLSGRDVFKETAMTALREV